jgi:hypothetical protein
MPDNFLKSKKIQENRGRKRRELERRATPAAKVKSLWQPAELKRRMGQTLLSVEESEGGSSR